MSDALTIDQSVSEAAGVVREGGVIAYPTEAVFGLGCDPESEHALARILSIKQRDPNKGFILIAANQEQLMPFIQPLSDEHQAKVNQVWPGPVTFIVPANDRISSLLTGERPSIAVRVSSHPVVQALCLKCDTAIVSTSANLSGQAEIRSAADIYKTFGDQVDCVVEGDLGSLEAPTQIHDLISGLRIR